MKRFILHTAPDRRGMVRLAGDDYHYLIRVRRLAVGEGFPALLPNGEAALVRIRSVEGGELSGSVEPEIAGGGGPAEEANLPPIILFQSLPKGEKMDLIVRQAAEGGLSEIVPFISEHSIPKLDATDRRDGGKGAEKKQARWERIVKEARQQSGSTIATTVGSVLSMDGLFARWETLRQNRPGALGLLFHHIPLAQASLHGYLDSNPTAVALAIGPEGGFSPAEADRFLAAGFQALTIGNTVLRTETAALYAAAAIRTILLERDSWEKKPHQAGNG
jgi:16S rRNA (uracil1498-N3)-methyltransferase